MSYSTHTSTVPAWRSPARRRRFAAAALRPSTAQSAIAFLIFFGIGLGIMWPAPLHAGSSLFGPAGADLTGEISYYRVLAHEHLAPFLPGTVHAFNAPEGRPTQWALNFSTLPSSAALWLGSMAIGAVATLAFWPVFTFSLSALSMFLFARWITGRWEAGFVAGLAWGFQPYVFSGQNQPLGDVFFLVLFAWRMFVVIERPTVRNGFWTGLTCLLAMMWAQYYLLIVGVALVVLAIYGLLIARSRRQLLREISAQACAAVPLIIGLCAIAAAGLASGFQGVPTRAATDLSAYSARPSMYFYPDPNNPFTGSLTRGYVNRHFNSPNLEYNEIYVGISVLIVAAVGLWLVCRELRRRGLRAAVEDRRIFVALPLSVLAVIAFLFSMPPRVDVFGARIPMPLEVIGKVTTVFRTVARFEILVMLALCVLLAIAIAQLLPLIQRAWIRVLVLLAASFVVTADLWARAPFTITRVDPPRIYRVLAQQPKGIYAEYPILPGSAFGGLSFHAFYQGYAGDHDLFDGFFEGAASEAPKLALENLLDPTTAKRLAGYGVKYVLVDSVPIGVIPKPYPRQGQSLPGARLIARDPYGSLYRVTARPPQVAITTTSGFAPQESAGGREWQWMTNSVGTLQITSRRPGPVVVRVAFDLTSFAAPRKLGITDGQGHFVYRGSTGSSPTRVTFTARVDRSVTLHLFANPGPTPVPSVIPGSADRRSLAIQVFEPISVRRVR